MALPFYDLDAEIEALSGRSIADIFAVAGEPAFRELEARALRQVLNQRPGVVATGGGVVTRQENVEAMRSAGWVVYLAVKPEEAVKRVLAQQEAGGRSAYRPLLDTHDPVSRMNELYNNRVHLYLQAAHWIVQTDHVPVWAVAAAIVQGVRMLECGGIGPRQVEGHIELRSPLGDRGQRVLVGSGLLSRLGSLVRDHLGVTRALVITDSVVARHWLGPAIEGLGEIFLDAFAMPAGEGNKKLSSVRACYDWLARRRAERGDCIVGLGGGVVGDLAGFVASTYLRGMRLIQVPTTLLAMVDAAIGGKTGVNHPKAKNLIGTIYHADLVVADTETVSTLPQRELRAGLAEVIKYRAIATDVLGHMPPVLSRLAEIVEGGLPAEVLPQLIAECAHTKLEVVARDEREAGLRKLLNYGHTIGHALEAATRYRSLLHGEAIAVGMHAEAQISLALGLVDASFVEGQAALIRKAGLPLAAEADRERVMGALALDKKVRSGSNRWVLPAFGRMLVDVEVPEEVVRTAVEGVALGPKPPSRRRANTGGGRV